MPLAAVVLTFNEERNLDACLESLAGWVSELHVVDSGSTDQTLAIAARHGARVTSHPFETHARQWQWALQSLPIQADWVLALDADQRVTPELAAEIAQARRRSTIRRSRAATSSGARSSGADGFATAATTRSTC